MTILATEMFRAITDSRPKEVWDALTTTGRRLDYFYGLALHADWQPGATITASFGERHQIGEVITVDDPHRLTYTLGDMTVARYAGTIVSLTVDEPRPADDITGDLEDIWLPALAGLNRHLNAISRRNTGPPGPAARL